MEVDMMADMGLDVMAAMEIDKVADIDIDISINMEIQFVERVGQWSRPTGLINWAQTYSTRNLPGLHIF